MSTVNHNHADLDEMVKEIVALAKQGKTQNVLVRRSQLAALRGKLKAHGYDCEPAAKGLADEGTIGADYSNVDPGAKIGHSDPRDGKDESAEMQRIVCDETSPGVSKVSQEIATKAVAESQQTLTEFHETRGEDNFGGVPLNGAPSAEGPPLRGAALLKALAALETMAANPGCSAELKAAVKSFASEQQARTAASVALYQNSNTGGNPATIARTPSSSTSPGVSGAAGNVDRVRMTREDVGGTSGSLGTFPVNRFGELIPQSGNPRDELQKIEKELADVQAATKSGSISDRERDLLQKRAYQRLYISHGGC